MLDLEPRKHQRPDLSPADTRTIALPQPSRAEPPAQPPQLLIGVERRAFFQGCLSLWLGRFCEEFGTAVVEDLRSADIVDQAAAVIIGIGSPLADAGWLEEQIGWLRSLRPLLPVAAIADDAHHERVEALARHFGIQGFIPASTSVGIAAAATRLIVAGGSYFPRALPHDDKGDPPSPEAEHDAAVPFPASSAASIDRLTPREAAVLELLGRGTPNKIIAYRLGISLSTAKVHVHNIIKKLNAHNRTEVALVARQLLRTQARSAGGDLREAALPDDAHAC
ncbi:MAG: response regulator transcription factor [Rhodospirillales bacterium]|nr:response regulator transcription factor [Rhodospirillales bacterium]